LQCIEYLFGFYKISCSGASQALLYKSLLKILLKIYSVSFAGLQGIKTAHFVQNGICFYTDKKVYSYFLKHRLPEIVICLTNNFLNIPVGSVIVQLMFQLNGQKRIACRMQYKTHAV
jgi:hypothetical protein